MLTLEDAQKLGASDFPALTGLSEWSGVVALWARMAHGVQQDIGIAGSEGHIAEEYNRALYRNRTGYILLGPASWSHPLYPWLRCSPDDRAMAPEGRRNVELKRYNNPTGWGPEGSDAVPEGIWLQVQVQQGVGLDNGHLEATTADVSALLRGELRIYSVAFQPEVYERCLAMAERFVVDFVQPKRFPEGPGLVLLERDVEALRTLYSAPVHEEPLAWEALTTEAQQVVRRWLEANTARKAWEAQEGALSGQVQALLREVPGLLLPEALGKRVDYQTTRPSAVTNWRAVAEDLMNGRAHSDVAAVMAAHTTQRAARPLRAR